MGNPQRRTDYDSLTGANIGAINSASSGFVTNEEHGDDIFHQTKLIFASLPVVTGNTTGASFGSKRLYDFPTARMLVLGVTAYFRLITFNTVDGSTGDIDGGGSGDYSIGTTATADATLATTDVDLLPSSAMLDPFVVGVGRSNTTTNDALAAAAQFDGSGTAKSAFLNVIIDDADVSNGAAADNVYFTGWARITWVYLG